jgi:hypothetical protein
MTVGVSWRPSEDLSRRIYGDFVGIDGEILASPSLLPGASGKCRYLKRLYSEREDEAVRVYLLIAQDVANTTA